MVNNGYRTSVWGRQFNYCLKHFLSHSNTIQGVDALRPFLTKGVALATIFRITHFLCDAVSHLLACAPRDDK
jgi:hypothetical protein